MKKIILASKSNRRRSLMPFVTNEFIVKPVNVDESINQSNNSNEEQALEIAKRKVNAIFEKYPDYIIVAGHTIIDVHGVKLGKPVDDEDSKRMLSLLRGKTHTVTTAVYIKSFEKDKYFFCSTIVEFENMSDEEIEYYVNTGEGLEKAGGYAIYGLGGRYVSKINGDFFNVLGLPIFQLYHALKDFE